MRVFVSGAIDSATRERLCSFIEPRGVRMVSGRTLQLDAPETLSVERREAVTFLCATSSIDHWFDEHYRTLADIRLIAMDMDSTLITVECIDELAACVGKSDEVSRITEATMRGEIRNFEASLRARVALLRGMPAQVLETVLNERVRLTDGAEALLMAARGRGIRTVLVSGGFTYFANALATRLSIDYSFANNLEVINQQLSGRVTGAVVDGQAKARFVRDIAERHELSQDEILVIGDGANDIPMMNTAGMSVAFHAKPIVKSVATCAIDFGDLGVLQDWLDASSMSASARY